MEARGPRGRHLAVATGQALNDIGLAGPGANVLRISSFNGGQLREAGYYHSSTLFSVYALSDANESVIERYRYDAYGACTVLDADGSADGDGLSEVKNPYLFQTRRWDGEISPYQFRNRGMSPPLGTCLQRDRTSGEPHLPGGRAWETESALYSVSKRAISPVLVTLLHGDAAAGGDHLNLYSYDKRHAMPLGAARPKRTYTWSCDSGGAKGFCKCLRWVPLIGAAQALESAWCNNCLLHCRKACLDKWPIEKEADICILYCQGDHPLCLARAGAGKCTFQYTISFAY